MWSRRNYLISLGLNIFIWKEIYQLELKSVIYKDAQDIDKSFFSTFGPLGMKALNWVPRHSGFYQEGRWWLVTSGLGEGKAAGTALWHSWTEHAQCQTQARGLSSPVMLDKMRSQESVHLGQWPLANTSLNFHYKIRIIVLFAYGFCEAHYIRQWQ